MLALAVPTVVPVPAPLCPAHSLPQPSLTSPQLLGQKVPLSYQQPTLTPLNLCHRGPERPIRQGRVATPGSMGTSF